MRKPGKLWVKKLWAQKTPPPAKFLTPHTNFLVQFDLFKDDTFVNPQDNDLCAHKISSGRYVTYMSTFGILIAAQKYHRIGPI